MISRIRLWSSNCEFLDRAAKIGASWAAWIGLAICGVTIDSAAGGMIQVQRLR